MKRNKKSPGLMGRIFLLHLSLVLSPALLWAQDTKAVSANADSSLYLKVQLKDRWKASLLKPGDVVEGRLSQNVYWGDEKVFPTGSRVRLVVDRIERRRRVRNDHWPWIVRVFTPRYEKYPSFRSTQVLRPNGKEVDLQVTLVSISREFEMHVKPQKKERDERKVSAELEASSHATTISTKAGRN